MKSDKEHIEDIIIIGRRLYERGFIAAGDGNISVRVSDGIWTTPRSVCKGFLTPDMMVKVSLDGKQKLAGHLEPSSELAMHLLVYENRPDIHAVVHAHPPCSTGFAAAGRPLDRALISEVVLTLGCVPLAAYGTPSTSELTAAMYPYVKQHDAMLMANHGAVAYGPNLETAYGRLETVEHFARISLVATLLGGAKELTNEEVTKLVDLREKSNLMPSSFRNQACGYQVMTSSPSKASYQAPSASAQAVKNDFSAADTLTLTRQELVDLIIAVHQQVTQLTK
jgi:L-fuculose-phosphate aldolase